MVGLVGMLLVVNRAGYGGGPLLYGTPIEVCKGRFAAVMHVWVVCAGEQKPGQDLCIGAVRTALRAVCVPEQTVYGGGLLDSAAALSTSPMGVSVVGVTSSHTTCISATPPAGDDCMQQRVVYLWLIQPGMVSGCGVCLRGAFVVLYGVLSLCLLQLGGTLQLLL